MRAGVTRVVLHCRRDLLKKNSLPLSSSKARRKCPSRPL
jgi:hypothetical protein